MVIVSVRGTSGSGKSTVVRRVMEKYHCESIEVGWRKRPLGYLCYAEGHRTVFIPGHYETDCGGCDSLPSIEFTFKLMRKYMDQNCDVIYEGLITQSDVNRLMDLHKEGHEVHVFGINLPLKECLVAVQGRRDARAASRGKESSPLNPSNTKAKHHQVSLQEAKFKRIGVDFRWLGRDETVQATLEVLGWNA